VAVVGAGPVGLLCVQVAKAAGAGPVYVSEPAPARARAALESGAAAVVDPMREDPVERIVQLTGGLGPSVVFECAAAEQTLQQSLDMVCPGGQVVVVSLAWRPQWVLSADWITREAELKVSYGSKRSEEWLMALDLMRRGLVRWEALINESCFVPLDRTHEAFEELTRPSTQLQLVVCP
jgi:threonine dehydrogenase-like Zn-dependent dehydrogenase